MSALRYLPSIGSGHVAQVTACDVHLFDPAFIRVERDRLREQAERCGVQDSPFARWADEIDAALAVISSARPSPVLNVIGGRADAR